MARTKKTPTDSEGLAKIRPAITPEAREQQLISLAVNLAEKQLREGTASSQVITHYLKLATQKEKWELEMLKAQQELTMAKTKAIHDSERADELYLKAIEAMRRYSGHAGEDDVY